MSTTWEETKREFKGRPIIRQGNPPPFWFAGDLPFPVAIRPSRKGCTRAHVVAAFAAAHVRTVLAALVALGRYDVGVFVENRLPGSAEKYLDYLRGRSVLRETHRVAMNDAIVRLAQGLAGCKTDVEDTRSWRDWKSVRQIAGTVAASPFVWPDFLHMEDNRINHLPVGTSGVSATRQEYRCIWADAVSGFQEIFGPPPSCRCHALQEAFVRGVQGPLNDRDIFGRGGDRRAL